MFCKHRPVLAVHIRRTNSCHSLTESLSQALPLLQYMGRRSISAVKPQNHLLYSMVEDDTYNFHKLPSLHPQQLLKLYSFIFFFSYILFIHQSRLCCSLKEKIGELRGQTTAERVSAEPEIVNKILMAVGSLSLRNITCHKEF